MILRSLACLALAISAWLATAKASSLCTAPAPGDRAALCPSNEELYRDPRVLASVSAGFLSVEGNSLGPAAPVAPRGRSGRIWKIILLLGGILVLMASLPLLAIWIIRQLVPESKSAICPNCGSSDVRISFIEGLLDRIFALASYSPYRCKICTYRYYRKSSGGPGAIHFLEQLKVPRHPARQ
ncbi:MAG TPA: hypothetical protein VG672_18430 [Bryobacteraceae bacterium]|jgi:hypothetical protein|nr:hypothetical protein [Bryobacteraceae bacterium]